MKKVLLSVVLVAAIVGYVIYQHVGGNTAPVIPNTEPDQSSGQTVATTSAATYKDGTYTGPVADAFYGNLQVRATIVGGRITDVAFLDYPQKNGNDIEINTHAMPILKSEAIQIQSAKVNIVSGATQTSEAFQQSLQGALAMAQN
jgi:uncharacterized protein with FMN-binding domain